MNPCQDLQALIQDVHLLLIKILIIPLENPILRLDDSLLSAIRFVSKRR